MTHSFLGESSILSLSMPGPSRDPTYYISDGNSVFLVENTLFKVHRSTLMKDKSAFETMFQLSSETDSSRSDMSATQSTEGDADENPIRLQGDTADEFRALLWSLYALPHELVTALTPEADITPMYNLARIANKYQFRSLESWALSSLYTYFSRPGAFDNILTTHPPVPPSQPSIPGISLPHPYPSPSITPTSTSHLPPSLVQLTELSALCERFDLLDLTLYRWRHLIGESNSKDLALAIDVGERFNLRSITGLAYHGLLLKGKTHWDALSFSCTTTTTTSPSSSSDVPLLTRERRIRLITGYYSLCKLWDTLPTTPPPLAHTSKCTSQTRCTKAFTTLWRTALESWSTQPFLQFQREDVLGKVMWTESQMAAFVEGRVNPHGALDEVWQCKENVLAVMSLRFKEIKEGLADHFVDDF
ncbi:hypothetical protein BDY19DRAFT_892283 [Irpex rosettiformis]|uniref:Uncharacterized protein n=1 Tax=Irpex rosettiformis TaxID=378272 RepID=A0ACB8U0Q1_9APHY|nr:hypothetical protein BDY19DRAFT_892283 [Irpex rosettiformis]